MLGGTRVQGNPHIALYDEARKLYLLTWLETGEALEDGHSRTSQPDGDQYQNALEDGVETL